MGRPRIAVVGAGVGGLTTVLALADAGLRSTAFERAPALAADGFGIQIPPNASLILHRLGLGPALDAVALRPTAREIRRWNDGAVLGRIPLGDTATRRYGAPYYALRRADLVRVLYDACDPADVRFDARCVGATEEGLLRFADGTSHPADVVVGADGLHSQVRAAVAFPSSFAASGGGSLPASSVDGSCSASDGGSLLTSSARGSCWSLAGDRLSSAVGGGGRSVVAGRALCADEPRFIGHTAYRAVLPIDDARSQVTVWLGPGRHCVTYPVPGGLNLVAIVPGPLEGAFDGWHPELRELVAAAAPTMQHGLFDRPALPTWHRGRLVVIGDAAHPMPPFVAQGAAQAIEDAEALAAALTAASTAAPTTAFTDGERGVEDGLKRFEERRRPRVERVVAASIDGGRESHRPDGAEQRRRDERIAGSGLPEQDWLYRC